MIYMQYSDLIVKAQDRGIRLNEPVVTAMRAIVLAETEKDKVTLDVEEFFSVSKIPEEIYYLFSRIIKHDGKGGSKIVHDEGHAAAIAESRPMVDIRYKDLVKHVKILYEEELKKGTHQVSQYLAVYLSGLRKFAMVHLIADKDDIIPNRNGYQADKITRDGVVVKERV